MNDLSPAARVEVFLHWVEERHKIYLARQAGLPQPWTSDHILSSIKMTNVYRVLDPGSQFVLTDLAPAGDDPLDVLMRCFLYRYTNLPATWREFGQPVNVHDLPAFRAMVKERRARGEKIFSGAYMILGQPGEFGDKVDHVFDLAERLVTNGSFEKFLAAENQQTRLEALKDNRGVGDFLGFQVVTDWGYTPQCGEDRENEFVVFGPGSKRGAAWLGVKSIEEARAMVLMDTDVMITLPDGGARRPSMMDVQNCLCELGKYVRFLNGKAMSGKPYHAAHPGVQPDPVLPDHWKAS